MSVVEMNAPMSAVLIYRLWQKAAIIVAFSRNDRDFDLAPLL